MFENELFVVLAKTTERSIEEFNARGLANTACAFATASFPNAELPAVSALTAKRRIGGFTAQELAITAWAFAKAGSPNAELFVVLTKIAERRIEEFNAEGDRQHSLDVSDDGQFTSG